MKELEALKVIIKNLNNNKTIDDIEFATMDRIIEDAECKVKNLHLQNVRLSLRDVFATDAMNALTNRLATPEGYANCSIDSLAKEAYDIADAMLKARESNEA
jgi:hypothetical protein